MTEPGLAGMTTVASWGFRFQFHEVVCTHYGAELAYRADRAIRVVPSKMNFVTQPWAAAEGRTE
jgi:hypothetical protein